MLQIIKNLLCDLIIGRHFWAVYYVWVAARNQNACFASWPSKQFANKQAATYILITPQNE